jgi:hypothetical protein
MYKREEMVIKRPLNFCIIEEGHRVIGSLDVAHESSAKDSNKERNDHLKPSDHRSLT